MRLRPGKALSSVVCSPNSTTDAKLHVVRLGRTSLIEDLVVLVSHIETLDSPLMLLR